MVNPGSDDVSVINLAINAVVATIDVGRFPIGVAIHTAQDLAYVTNGESGTVSVIDLNTLAVVDTITVGSRPAGVAISTNDNRAIVANRADDTVSVIDTRSGQVIQTLEVGRFPRAVAVHEGTSQAVVTNAGGNSVTVFNLRTEQVETETVVGIGPSGAGIDTVTGQAVVSNSEVSAGSTAVSGLGTVSVVDLRSGEVVETIPSGSAPFGLDVDEAGQRLVVANFGGNDITIMRIPIPTPLVEQVEPRTFPATGETFTITVLGSGFVPISVVTLNGVALPTTFISSEELRAEVPQGLITELLETGSQTSAAQTAGQAQTTPFVFNVGVTSGNENSPEGGQIQPENLVPVLVTITPAQAEAGIAGQLVTLSGNNLNGTSIVNFGGGTHSPLAVTATTLTVELTGVELTQPGDYPVTVFNPAPGGGPARR